MAALAASESLPAAAAAAAIAVAGWTLWVRAINHGSTLAVVMSCHVTCQRGDTWRRRYAPQHGTQLVQSWTTHQPIRRAAIKPTRQRRIPYADWHWLGDEQRRVSGVRDFAKVPSARRPRFQKNRGLVNACNAWHIAVSLRDAWFVSFLKLKKSPLK